VIQIEIRGAGIGVVVLRLQNASLTANARICRLLGFNPITKLVATSAL